MTEKRPMRIGALAREAGVPAKTIRYYEEIGLLPGVPRTEAGYRLYGPEAVDLLRFIRKAQGLGLSLCEIRELAEIRAGGSLPCAHLRSLLAAKVADLDARIRAMKRLRDEMQGTLRGWDRRVEGGREAVVCPHIEGRPEGEPPPRNAAGASLREARRPLRPTASRLRGDR